MCEQSDDGDDWSTKPLMPNEALSNAVKVSLENTSLLIIIPGGTDC